MDVWQNSTTKLEALHQKRHFLISLPSLLMGVNYPTDYVAALGAARYAER